MAGGQVTRGLSDVKLYVLGADDAPGTALDVPGARTFSIDVSADLEEHKGDDQVIAVASSDRSGSGSLEWGKTSLEVRAALFGGTVETTGVTPNVVKSLTESSAPVDDYVQIKGQARGMEMGGSGYVITVHKAKPGGDSESLGIDEWNSPSVDFSFMENADGEFITREQQETLVALT